MIDMLRLFYISDVLDLQKPIKHLTGNEINDQVIYFDVLYIYVKYV